MIFDLEYDRAVVGGDLQSLKYATENDCPVVYYKPSPPSIFDGGRGEWEELCLNLSLGGRIPFGDKVAKIRLEENKLIVVAANRTYSLKFKNLAVSDTNIEGLPEPLEKCDVFKVIDWINVYSGMTHEHERIESTSDFVKCVLFYPTTRLDGHHPNKKDAAAISYMSKEQINDPEWSDTYVRLKVLNMMDGVGIKGKIETVKREIIPVKKNIYPELEFIEFI